MTHRLSLALFRDDHFLPLRLGFGLARARVPPPPLLLDALSLFHRSLELCSLVHGLWYVSTPIDRGRISKERARGEQITSKRRAYRCTLPISASIFHRSLSAPRYSIAERSRAVTMPSFSEASAFQIRTLPSSEPESTKRASEVKVVASTRCMRFGWYTSGWVPPPSCHMRKVRSHPPETNSVPVGDQSQDVTAETCAL